MLLKVAIASALFSLCLGYAAYPCVTLYELQDAVRRGDSARMSHLVDWVSVRNSLDEQIAAESARGTDTQAIADGSQLAPFGFGFVRGVASKAIETRVTPRAVLRAFHSSSERSGLRPSGAWFDSPTAFVVRFVDQDGNKVRLRLDLEDGRWRVTRVWVPRRLIEAAETSATIPTAVIHAIAD